MVKWGGGGGLRRLGPGVVDYTRVRVGVRACGQANRWCNVFQRGLDGGNVGLALFCVLCDPVSCTTKMYGTLHVSAFSR